MFSSTLKQSLATLGVVAGLLAAAGPASAQILDGRQGATVFRGEIVGLEPIAKAPDHGVRRIFSIDLPRASSSTSLSR